MRRNKYGIQAGKALWDTLSTNTRIEKFNDIPLKEIRDGKTTKLNCSGEGLGDGDAYVLAELFKVGCYILLSVIYTRDEVLGPGVTPSF